MIYIIVFILTDNPIYSFLTFPFPYYTFLPTFIIFSKHAPTPYSDFLRKVPLPTTIVPNIAFFSFLYNLTPNPIYWWLKPLCFAI